MGSIGMVVALLLTLMILSYLIDDTAVYRLAASLLVGLSVGYFMAVVLWNVLISQWREIMTTTDSLRRGLLFLQVGLGVLILAKGVPRLGLVGDLGLAIALGIGLGTAGAGAVFGTLGPQLMAGVGQGISVGLVATLLALLAAQFYRPPARGPVWGRVWTGVQALGRAVWAFALGALFGSALITGISLLIGRAEFLIQTLSQWWR
ncbi:hypothetical protein [Thermoflexus sp.]|uniref:hypothetical protein n=1 Tax=Thermoflexus sp. TaxID=1969742 RepID=UPI0025D0183D|nr:hypothetical protein [Thermoflexus sp.]MDW8179947.1 hypothetical protein [Anaerolineae bacterium]MCS6963924.1 hypothetical protein [Thermoflexus sp.]MCS7350496.1 hypothetical protein [Thermoflexus sp.]MCX7690331.1 hypothetical protein [Thermoflexus sp.]MDW8184443.1 hypothetical protein [Anaerolineae bacterium]